MSIQLKNNASGFLAAALSATATSATLQSGEGANFPSLTATQFFYVTLASTAGAVEIVKVTGRTGDVLTIQRAQEGTTAQSFPALSRAELRISAQTIYDVIDSAISSTELAVSNIASVIAVAGSINAVGVVSANVGVVQTVANNIVDVGTVADSILDINAVADDLVKVTTVADNIADVNTVADNIQVVVDNVEDITAVAGFIVNVNTVADNETEITTVSNNLTGTNTIGTVAGAIANVNAVGSSISTVNTVAANIANVNTVATNLSGTNTVGTVAGSIANVNTVGNNIANVNSVAGNSTNINTVATNIAGIQTTVANLSAILLADDYAAAAAGSAASALAIYGNTAAQQAAVIAAQNAASVAAGHAASASSVVQQDLSGVNAAALHRSPNAITAMFVYDTSKDSDGGAWTERCQHTSWWNETLNATWRGALGGATLDAAETTARAISGAATNDYFQYSSNGKFYRLNIGSGTTEVFRGNKRDFPRVAAIVAEAENVNIYDLTEPGRPMWMRFVRGNAQASWWSNNNANTVTSLAMLEGYLVIGRTAFASLEISFPKELSFNRYTSNDGNYNLSGIAQRLSTNAAGPTGVGIPGIAGTTVNSVAMTVLPDAPLDPVSGLRVPTIAVATSGGISVIKADGTVVSNNAIGAVAGLLAFDGRGFIWHNAGGNGNYLARSSAPANQLGSGWVHNFYRADQIGFNISSSEARFGRRESGYFNTYDTPRNWFGLARSNQSALSRLLHARIENAFNAGYQTGDIRRVYLSDNAVGSIGPSTELVTNGTFATDTTGWAIFNQATGTLAWDSGRMRITNTGAFANSVLQTITGIVPGRAYRVTVTIEAGSPTGNPDFVVSNSLYGQITTGSVSSGTSTRSFTFIAVGTTAEIRARTNSAANGVAYFDNISVQESIADRSYKAGSALVTGTLTRSEVAAAAELVAYSGFSVSNYAREPYSADLDFGTGEWSVSAWASIPTGNAAAATIAAREHSSGAYIRLGITSGNALTATAHDGTTTRTVTTSAAYNTGTWLKVRANYTTDGTMALLVNGVEVATTRGNPLLTLNNSSATLTIGNSQALDAPFPGSIALLKLSATVPTAEQSVWMYEQEKQLFRAGAKCCLPDSGNIVDLTYDDATDRWIAVSAANESEWAGLVRTSVTPVPAGSYTKAAAASGIQLLARSTTNPGVDVSIPAYGLREELVRRAEAAARLNKDLVAFDYVGGFTATTVNGNTAITSVANLSYPGSVVGAAVTGSGIPAGATIVAISGTTVYLSAAATASASGVQINFTDFHLPVGYEAEEVSSAGTAKQEGATKDWTRRFDGFRETIRFGTAPGNTTWVQIQASRSVQ